MDDLAGSHTARERLRWILRAMNGEVTVARACAELGIGESRFHQLRGEMLQAAVDRLEPRAAGRPAKSDGPAEWRIDALVGRVVELTRECDLAQIRLELTGAVPVSVKKNPSAGCTASESSVEPVAGEPAGGAAMLNYPVYVESAEPRRSGLQRARRKAEQIVRRTAVRAASELRVAGADCLGYAESTLRAWKRRCREPACSAALRGRPCKNASSDRCRQSWKC